MDHYTYRVAWDDTEGEFVGLCDEIPTLSHYDSTREQALAGIVALAKAAVELMTERGQQPPAPLPLRRAAGQ
jgi:predicted RNase H-like HicB family nuclease